MRSLARVRIGKGSSGEPLPTVFPKLERMGIRPRRGQVMMVSAMPNGFKSGLALNWVVRLARDADQRVLYFSADTDEHDSKLRTLAILSGSVMSDIEQEYLRETPGVDYYDDLLSEVSGLEFAFEDSPHWEYMVEEILAHAEKWGDYPDVVVIDNLMNVVADGNDEWGAMKDVTKMLHHMAWKTGSAVFVLHHQNEGAGHSDPMVPAPRKAIAGKVNQIPELILSLAFDSYEGLLNVACVKNRSGPHSADGRNHESLFVDAKRMAVHETWEERKAG